MLAYIDINSTFSFFNCDVSFDIQISKHENLTCPDVRDACATTATKLVKVPRRKDFVKAHAYFYDYFCITHLLDFLPENRNILKLNISFIDFQDMNYFKTIKSHLLYILKRKSSD